MPHSPIVLRRGSFLLLFILFVATTARATTVVTLGDSTTEDNSKTTPAYPAILASDASNLTTINEGLSGDTSAGGLARLGSIIALHPQIVVIQYGGGDSFWEAGAAGPHVTVPNYVANLTTMVRLLRGAGITPVLMTPDPFLLPPPEVNYGPYAAQTPDDLAQVYAAAVRTLAPQLNVPLVDAFAALSGALGNLAISNSSYYFDYRHPTTLGEAVVAAAVQPVIASLVPEPSSFWIAGMALLGMLVAAKAHRKAFLTDDPSHAL
ncbi:MAG TPA: SGNH/GDSL hydrolase family protein [Pirellulales bacterium]|jgi:acyl-CoA thioesterase-1|nr:SGNH/GDSL hydrolase family protein [Pirellulales bacterium]